jgi:hypothetical protein
MLLPMLFKLLAKVVYLAEYLSAVDLAAILSNIFPALVYQKAQSPEAQHDELVIERIELAQGWNVEQSTTQ